MKSEAFIFFRFKSIKFTLMGTTGSAEMITTMSCSTWGERDVARVPSNKTKE